MPPYLNKNSVLQLLQSLGLPGVVTLENLTSTFSNDVQVINDKLILKTWDEKNIKWFRKELFCLTQLQDVIPVIPKVVLSNEKDNILGKPFIIMQKLSGKTLISVWDDLSDTQQQNVIREICRNLKSANSLDISGVPDLFPKINNWQEWIGREFTNNLKSCRDLNLLPEAELKRISADFQEYYPHLREQKMQVMYYDIHFGNFLINNGKLSGMIDFERTEWVSMDYCLNWIRRMMLAPGEYTSDKNPNPDKFKNLMTIFREYYPGLFAFDHLEERLKAYALISDLRIKLRRGIDHFLK
jgi:aminoglycoside phosphotransferase (APT) family kinase protein